MTTLMEEAIDALRHVSIDMQDDLARLVLHLAGREQPPYTCTDEEEAELARSEAEADRKEFATDEEVRALWAKHGL